MEAAAGNRGVEAFACLMDPGSAAFQPAARIGHDPAVYGSEAVQRCLRGAPAAPHAGPAATGVRPFMYSVRISHRGIEPQT
jgi:hypothetical protein